MRPARFAAFIVLIPILPGTTFSHSKEIQLAFLSAGCKGAGSVSATIKEGKVIVRRGGGNVTPDGVIHTVGAGNGLTLTAEGRLSGDAGSGTYDRSDGCSGTWIGVRQRR